MTLCSTALFKLFGISPAAFELGAIFGGGGGVEGYSQYHTAVTLHMGSWYLYDGRYRMNAVGFQDLSRTQSGNKELSLRYFASYRCS
jgi:hypothetical protein